MADQYEELRRAIEAAQTATDAIGEPWYGPDAGMGVIYIDPTGPAGRADFDYIAAANPQTIAALLAELDALRAATIKQSLTVETDYAELRRAIASGNPLTVYMHREAMMTPLEGDVRELVRELDALREDARDAARYREVLRTGVPYSKDVCFTNEQIGAYIDKRIADRAALHPSKDADSGEVGNG